MVDKIASYILTMPCSKHVTDKTIQNPISGMGTGEEKKSGSEDIRRP